MTDAPAAAPVEKEELRIALALNGGVGLAVWIGGVAFELERLVSRRGSYQSLLDLTATDARVDVISGSSAGGINGAFLATAIAHRTELASLRDLWVDQGDLADLLRDPLEKQPPSLMRGDDYFLPQLRRAFATLWNPNPSDRRSPDEAPIVLTLTTTLLRCEPNKIPDDYGTVITDVDYKARFVFERSPQTAADSDPFAQEALINQLALAARSTASFPGAFESSWVPMTQSTSDRPAMGAFMRPLLHDDRFVVDGGVLENKPVEEAVKAIFRQRADKPVRRVLAYVVPDPGSNPGANQEMPTQDEAPSAAEVAMQSLVTLPRYQSIGEELRSIQEHNRAVEEHRRARLSVVGLLDPATIDTVADEVFPVYKAVRKDTSIRHIVEQVSTAVSREQQTGFPFQGRREWLYSVFDNSQLPWVPKAARVDDAEGLDPHKWRWGNRAVEKVGASVLSLLRDVQSLAALTPERPGRLRQLWSDAFDVVLDADRLRKADNAFWQDQARQLFEKGILTQPSGADLGQLSTDVGAWLTETLEAWAHEPFSLSFGDERATTIQAAAGILAEHLAKTAFELLPVARAVLTATAAQKAGRVKKARLDVDKLVQFLTPDAAGTGAADAAASRRVLRRLLSLHVVTATLRGSDDTVEQNVELIQISGDTPSSVGGPSQAKGKLAGIQLGHFGAFYRRSWRANDWLQGRLDGARRIAQIVLSPARLRTVAGNGEGGRAAQRMSEAIAHLAFEEVADEKLNAALKQRYDENGVCKELKFLDYPEVPPPEMLPICVEAVARRFQVEILLQELPQLYQAVERDEASGARSDEGASVNFASAYRGEVPGQGAGILEPEVALKLYEGLRIGDETFASDMGSDLFSSTVSQFMATTARVVTNQNLPGFVNRVLGAARAPLLLLYLLVRNATSGRAGAALNGGVLAFGGLVVGLSLLTSQNMPGILTSAGWVALAAGLLLILLRNKFRPWQIAIPVVAVAGAGALTVWAGSRNGYRMFFSQHLLQAVIIVLFVAVFVYIGALHRPKASPHARAVRRLRRLPRGSGEVAVEVNGLPWKRVANVRSAEAGALVFELGADGKLRFGDGTHGSRPTAGAQIIVRYREGAGAAGNN